MIMPRAQYITHAQHASTHLCRRCSVSRPPRATRCNVGKARIYPACRATGIAPPIGGAAASYHARMRADREKNREISRPEIVINPAPRVGARAVAAAAGRSERRNPRMTNGRLILFPASMADLPSATQPTATLADNDDWQGRAKLGWREQ
jgi:ribosomal protein L40E